MKLQTSFRTAVSMLTLTAGVAGMAVIVQAAETIDPDHFSTRIDNRFFPLVPGLTYIYVGTKEGSPQRDEFQIMHRTKVIMGVTCREVRDRAFVDGVLEENTLDWFAQDDQGNVWYFGEDTKELDEDGNVISTEGSWEAGVHGALPGIIMQANPRVGDTYQQEFSEGVAEDMATVLSLKKTVKLTLGTFTGCLATEEFTPLEPGAIDRKFYAPGIGFVRSVALGGGKERLELVRIVRNN